MEHGAALRFLRANGRGLSIKLNTAGSTVKPGQDFGRGSQLFRRQPAGGRAVADFLGRGIRRVISRRDIY